MSVIIEFPARNQLKSSPKCDGRQGVVVIFPGVRIERREFNLTDRVANARRRPAAANHAEDFDRS